MTSVKRKHEIMVSLRTDSEIVLTRSFDAPRDLVFEAFTKPEHIRQWWGCDESELKVCEMDFREGGKWRHVIAMKGKGEFAFSGVYKEIIRPELLVYTSIFEMFPANVAVESVGFEENDGITTLTCTSKYPSRQVRDAVIASGMETGAAQSYDRLERLVQTFVK